MKRGTPQHPKTLALASLLGVPRYAAVGLLESLWHFAGAYARRGNVGRHSAQAIAAGVGWDGDPDVLVQALVGARWLDECPCHGLRVHDWPEHADQAVSRSKEVRSESWLECYSAPFRGPSSEKLETSSESLAPSSLERSPTGIRQTADGTGHRATADGNGRPAMLRSPPSARGRPPNPFIAGRRPDLERELQELVPKIAEREGLDPTEVLAQLSEWRGHSYVNPAAMPDDRLAHTLRAARKRAGGEPEPREAAPSEGQIRATAVDLRRRARSDAPVEEFLEQARQLIAENRETEDP